ncbi:hypothetical protein NDU88_000462 [Pleurodeles waltl]|uniref:C-type lectin domain-containing protein n=1 Tax=Pleurodeles waltl TaxID=8319 RepID=A0AAV7P0Y0_PLEWA|nr:hypothetical protein NDU88_000462 [Pleurodeles waltl]
METVTDSLFTAPDREDSVFLPSSGGTPSTQISRRPRGSASDGPGSSERKRLHSALEKDAPPPGHSLSRKKDELSPGSASEEPGPSTEEETSLLGHLGLVVKKWWREVLILLLVKLLVISFIINVLPAGASLPPCPKDWIWTNGKCYFFSHKKKTWNQSQKFCESYNGNLAIILDQNTLHTIRHYKTIDDSWIGLRKSNGIWSWVNGSRFSGLLLSLAQDIPGLHCAYLNMDKYGILDCTSMRNWICTRNSSFSITDY